MLGRLDKGFLIFLVSILVLGNFGYILIQSYAVSPQLGIEDLFPEPSTTSNANNGSLQIFLYASESCGKCKEQVNLLRTLWGNDSVNFCEVSHNQNTNYYVRIRSYITDNKIISASEPNLGLVPLSGLFKNNQLAAAIFGSFSEENWKKIESDSDSNVVYFYIGSLDYNVTLNDQSKIKSLGDLFDQVAPLTDDSSGQDLTTLIPAISLAAAIDAVNPCELNAYLILLVYVFYNIGKKEVLKIGFSFSLAVFISYYIMGLGALKILQNVPLLKWAILVFGLTIGSLEILGFLGLERKHVPNSFATRIRENLKKATNPYTAFIAGILVSLFLLPCTSGSYFVALDLLAKNATAAEGLLLLTLYNVIVVLPFIAIGVAIYTLTFRTAKLRIWLTRNEKWLRLFGGVTMIFISLLLIT